MPIRVDARIRRDRKTWSIYYSLFQYRRCDRQSVDVKSQFSRFILSNTFCTFCTLFLHFLHYLTEKNKKRYSTDDTVADENQFKISRQTRCVFVVVPFLRGRFSLLSSRALFDGLLCFFFLYLSLKGEELFYSDGYSRAKSARDDAARSASFFEC